MTDSICLKCIHNCICDEYLAEKPYNPTNNACLYSKNYFTERMESEGGCEYCATGAKQILSMLICWGDTRPKEPSYYNPAIKHKYCPMCGRKLSGTDTNVPTNTQAKEGNNEQHT